MDMNQGLDGPLVLSLHPILPWFCLSRFLSSLQLPEVSLQGAHLGSDNLYITLVLLIFSNE